MAVDEVQFLNILKGKRIKLSLKTSSFFGVIQRINLNKTLILADVVSGHNGLKCPGSKMFFGHEVINVEFANEADTDSGNIHDHGLEEYLNVERFQPYRKTITLDEDEQEYFNFVVIDEFQEKFGSAVMHIKKQHVISVGADGVEVFKHGRLCWLQIATKHKVYLFDILLLGARAFKNGLSMILESQRILKVIHDCRAFAGCLIAQFGVKLTNVFDTQVADVMCFYSKTGGLLPNRVSTLQEVVSLHLKVPSSQLLSLQMKSQLTKEEREMWYERPCPIPLLKVMALSTIHLQPLRLVLMDNLMMDYMALVDSYLNSSLYEPDELQHVSMESVLALPRELRQLEEMCRERQEWAADYYPVTEQGLLDRYNPRTRSPSQTLPAAEENGQESPSQVDPLLPKSPTSPPRANVLSMDVCASPDSAGQPPVPTKSSDLGKQMAVNSPLSLGAGRGCTEVLMNTAGRGCTEVLMNTAGRGCTEVLMNTAGRGCTEVLMNTAGRGCTEVLMNTAGRGCTEVLMNTAGRGCTEVLMNTAGRGCTEVLMNTAGRGCTEVLMNTAGRGCTEVLMNTAGRGCTEVLMNTAGRGCTEVLMNTAGRGCTEVLMNTAGRGSPLGKEQSSIPALRAFRRCSLFQISQDQVPRESMGDVIAPDRMETAPSGHSHTPAQEVIPQPGPSVNDLPKDGTTGHHVTSTPESISSSLAQSFRSFRY